MNTEMKKWSEVYNTRRIVLDFPDSNIMCCITDFPEYFIESKNKPENLLAKYNIYKQEDGWFRTFYKTADEMFESAKKDYPKETKEYK